MSERADATGAALVGIGLGIGVGILSLILQEPALRGVSWRTSVAIGAVASLPGLLALASRGGRPVLLVAAAIASLPVIVLSFVGLVLFAPAIVYLVVFGRATARPRGRIPSVFTVAVVVGLAIVTVGYFLALRSTVCYSVVDEGSGLVTHRAPGNASGNIPASLGPNSFLGEVEVAGCSGGISTPAGLVVTLALAGVTVGSGRALASPRPQP